MGDGVTTSVPLVGKAAFTVAPDVTKRSTYNPSYPSVQRAIARASRPRKVLRMTPAQIRLMRRQLGWTQQELANRLLTDVITVSRWERGVQLPSSKYFKVMRRWAGLDEPRKKVPEKPGL